MVDWGCGRALNRLGERVAVLPRGHRRSRLALGSASPTPDGATPSTSRLWSTPDRSPSATSPARPVPWLAVSSGPRRGSRYAGPNGRHERAYERVDWIDSESSRDTPEASSPVRRYRSGGQRSSSTHSCWFRRSQRCRRSGRSPWRAEFTTQLMRQRPKLENCCSVPYIRTMVRSGNLMWCLLT